MCGIVGILKSGTSHTRTSELLEYIRAIAHRGPDDEGSLFIRRSTGEFAEFPKNPSTREAQSIPSIDENIAWIDSKEPDLAIGHRRFSIIDTSRDGHQPFWSADGRACVICNGEIYNYLELRDELKRLGHRFHTASDTEVIVEGYRAWGDECFERFNGMWALAIYDFDKQELILCRDRTGERPLYWVKGHDGVYFASEIKALLSGLGDSVHRKVNSEAAHNFLRQAVSDLDTRTFFEGIEQIQAGTIIRIAKDNQISSRRYWRVPAERPSARSAKEIPEYCGELRRLLRDSVSLRLRADVPVNVALSGGLDSSTVVAMASQLRNGDIDSYTVRFEEPEWNEWPFASAVLTRYGTRNMVVDPPHEWIWENFDRFVIAMEEPFHAPDLIPDHVIRRILAARGYRVSLSGIGGDELFAGYDHYRQLRILDLKRNGRAVRAAREILLASDTSPARAGYRLVTSKLNKITGLRNGAVENLYQLALSQHDAQLRELPASCDDRLKSDIEWSLMPYWLRVGDKSSMAIPIEVRYPFLDHRIVEFAMGLPVDWLIRDGWTKWILRKAVEDILPREVVWRRKKMGFPFPIKQWLCNNAERLKALFSQMDNPFLSTRFWSKRLEDAIEFDPWLVWRSLSFELWHRFYIRGLPVHPVVVSGGRVNPRPSELVASTTL
ncbi:MAG TPA: asparagine synthase (glutamine-hydrolyzing) [Blastocatellia bacterium]|nr:asparagine synthase (glutamine-hydrolyzing) [Blastocatellia bacterium]